MTYEQFENRLHDLLDEGRLDEADRLLASVCPSDESRCRQLLETYRALFASLPSALHSHSTLHTGEREVSNSPARVSAERRRANSPLGLAGMALAVCLTILVMRPAQRDDHSVRPPLAESPPVAASSTREASPSEVATLVDLNQGERHFTRVAASSFQPLAQNVVTRTGSAFRSLERFAGTLNPMDDHIAAYREAAPLISTLTRGFLPGTHSLGSAFSVLQESATPSQAISADAAPERTPEPAAAARTVG